MSESKKAIDALKALSLQAAVPTDTLATALAELSGLAATAAQLEAVSLSSALRSDDLIDNFAEATKRQHDELLRAALGPFEDLKNRLLIEARLVPQIDMSAFSTQMEALNASFRLPALSEWKDLTSEALLSRRMHAPDQTLAAR
jgi:hypothetical protein